MSDNPELSVEARLIDYISANLNTITRNIQQFESTAGGSFGKVTGAATETTDAMGGLSKMISGDLLRSVGGLALGFGGLASIGMFVGKMQEAYKEAKNLQAANIQLTAALGYYSSGLREQAELLAEKHTMDETDIIKAQQRLANYVKEEATVKALIPAIINLAAAKGIDLARAADIVGRSIEGNEKVMGRFGITMTGAAGSAEKAASALKGLNEKFHGQREALDETVTGWEHLAKKAGDYLKVIGSIFTAETQQEMYQRDKAMLADPKRVKYGDIDVIREAREFVAKFEADNNRKQAEAEANQKAELLQNEKDKLDKLREEYLKSTSEGQLKLLRESEKKELDEVTQHTEYTEEQVKMIKLRYAQEIADKEKEISDKAREERNGTANAGTGVGKAMNVAAGYQTGTNAFNVGQALNSGQDFLASMAPSQDDITKAENLHNMYLSFEQKMNMTHIEDLKFLKDANLEFYMSDAESYEEYIKNKEAIAKKEQEFDKKSVAAAMEIGKAMGDAIASGYQKGKYNFHEALKEMLDEAVDFLDKLAIAAVASNTLSAIEESGNAIYGLVIGAAEAAGIEAVAGIAKAGISSFATGTRDAPGGLAYVHKDELINLPAHSQVYTKTETKEMMGDTVHFHFYGNTDSTTVDNIQNLLIEANRTGKLKRFKSVMQND
jgi:hypothetical protein